MFQNPKNKFVVDFNIEEVRTAVLRLDSLIGGCPVINNDKILNTVRLHRKGTLDLGYHVDFRLEEVSDSKTKVEIEVSRNLGTINTAVEVSISNNILKMVVEKFSIAVSKQDIKDREAYTLKLLTQSDQNGDVSFVNSKGGEFLDNVLADFMDKSIEEAPLLNSNGFYIKPAGFSTAYRYFVDQNKDQSFSFTHTSIHKKGVNKYVFEKVVKPQGNFFQRFFKSETREQSKEFNDLKECIDSAINN